MFDRFLNMPPLPEYPLRVIKIFVWFSVILNKCGFIYAVILNKCGLKTLKLLLVKVFPVFQWDVELFALRCS